MIIRYALLYLLKAAEVLIFIRVIISWLPLGRNNFVEAIYVVTEPILAPIRALIDKSLSGRMTMIDFSPIVAFLLIGLIQRLIATSIFF